MDEEKIGVKIYPKLPTAPDNQYTELVSKTGSEYRLNKIIEIENYLREEIERRKHLCKHYKKANNIISAGDTFASTTSIGVGVTGAVLLSTIVAIPVALILEGVSIGTGGLCLIAKYANKKLKVKENKHQKIHILAESKLDTIHNHVSKAMIDGFISDDEFKLVLEEVEKYRILKEQLRKKTNNNDNTDKFFEKGKEEMIKKFENFYVSELRK